MYNWFVLLVHPKPVQQYTPTEILERIARELIVEKGYFDTETTLMLRKREKWKVWFEIQA